MHRPDEPNAGITRRGLIGIGAGAGLLAAGVVGPARAAQALRIVYGVPSPPMSFTEAAGLRGVLVDAFKEILATRLGWEVSHQGLPWRRAQDLVRDGDADAYCTSPTPERAEYMNFGSEPVLTMNWLIFYATANSRPEEIRQIKSLDEMRKFSQGDILGNGFAETHFKGMKIDWANSRDQVFKKVAAGHNDITVAGDLPGKWQLRQLGLADQFASVPLGIGQAATFNFGIRKSLANGEAMLRQVDTAVRAARADGTLTAFETRYS